MRDKICVFAKIYTLGLGLILLGFLTEHLIGTIAAYTFGLCWSYLRKERD